LQSLEKRFGAQYPPPMANRRMNRARELRQSAGLAATRVWEQVRRGAIDGHKFRREHPVGPYYADFACRRLRLVIEIDGGVHGLEHVRDKDERRQAEIEALGWTVLRFTNDEALLEPGGLAEAVRRHAAKIGVEG
jgi:very-short-patch-repair endonuclease